MMRQVWWIFVSMFVVMCLGDWSSAQAKARAKGTVSVQLPAGGELFPDGKGADLANAYCLMCHSADMVLLQPRLTLGEWTAEINKMRKAYGCPINEEQVADLAAYFAGRLR